MVTALAVPRATTLLPGDEGLGSGALGLHILGPQGKAKSWGVREWFQALSPLSLLHFHGGGGRRGPRAGTSLCRECSGRAGGRGGHGLCCPSLSVV